MKFAGKNNATAQSHDQAWPCLIVTRLFPCLCLDFQLLVRRAFKDWTEVETRFGAGPLRSEFRRACGILFVAVLVGSGCVTVGPNEQRLVSKPNMVFSQSAVFSYENKLLPELEPGTATSGGQTAGCTSCK